MSLYWFTGYLDQLYTINPIRLRGYDAAGNLLYAVRGHAIREHDLSHLAGTTQADYDAQADFADPYRFVNGFDEWGNARILFSKDGWRTYGIPQRQESIRAIAADSDGWIYCAMGPCNALQLINGATEASVRGLRETLIGQGQSRFYWGPEYDGLTFFTVPGAYVYDNGDLANTYGVPYLDFFRVYRQNGDRVPFPDLHGGPVWAVACDDTYFYLAGEGVGVNKEYLRKYNKAGAQQWAAQLPAWMPAKPARYTPAYTAFGVVIPEEYRYVDHRVNNILIDGSGNLYLTGNYWSQTSASFGFLLADGWLRKYNSSGVLQWERRFINSAVTNVVTDGTLFYVALYRTASQGPAVFNTYRIGETDYAYDTGDPFVEVVAWDADGDIARYAPARPNFEYGGWRYLSDGAQGARYLEYHDGLLYVAVGLSSGPDIPVVVVYDTADLSVASDTLSRAQYLAAANLARAHAHFKFDAGGSRVFSRVQAVAASPYTDSAAQYIANPVVAGHYFRYNDAGTQQWTDRTVLGWAYPGDLPNYPYAAATSPINQWADILDIAIVASPSLPALALNYALGITSWEGDRTTQIPGLPLRLALGVPDWIREYVGSVRLPDVYRLTLAGSPPLEFAVSSLSLRRTAFGRQLSAVIQPPGVAALELVEARLGATLTLRRGVRFADGVEQLETMFEVPLATVRADQGARSFSIALEGRAEEPESIPQSRVLRGVNYRNVGTGGQRRIRAAIDTYVRPGYTVIFGGDSLVVGEVVISIGPDSGVMELIEVAT